MGRRDWKNSNKKKNREGWGTWQYRFTPSTRFIFPVGHTHKTIKVIRLWFPLAKLQAFSDFHVYFISVCVQIALYGKQSTKCSSKLTWLLFKIPVHLLSPGRRDGLIWKPFQLHLLAFAVIFPMGPVILPRNRYFFASISDKFYITTDVVSN